jgi:hypothetical protein
MESLVPKFLDLKEAQRRTLDQIKSHMLVFKKVEAGLKQAMIDNQLHHVHVKEHRVTLNRSTADDCIRVYKWKLIYDDDEIEAESPVTIEALEFLACRTHKLQLQAQRVEIDEAIKEMTVTICQQCSNRCFLKQPVNELTLDIWPEANRIQIFKHRKASVST